MHLKFFVVLVLATLSVAQRRYYSLEDMPDTNFDCRDKILGGYYADPEANCQMFHVCVKIPGQGVQDFRFLCPNETAFDQENQICADSGDIDCESSGLYLENFDLYRIGSAQAKRPIPQIGVSKSPVIALGPSTKSPILTNNVYEDDDFYLQKSETGDRRLHSKDLLRGSSSSNFFNNRNKGKDLDDDDEESQPKRTDNNNNNNNNQFRPKPNSPLRPKTQYHSQFRKADPQVSTTTTTLQPTVGNQNQLNDKKRTKVAVRKLTRKRPEDEVEGSQGQQNNQQSTQSNFFPYTTQVTQKFGVDAGSRYSTANPRTTTTPTSFGTSDAYSQQFQQQQTQQGRFQNFKKTEQTTPAFYEASTSALYDSDASIKDTTPFSLLRNPIVAAGPNYNANLNRGTSGFQQSKQQTTANYPQKPLNGNYQAPASNGNHQNQQQQQQQQPAFNRQSSTGSANTFQQNRQGNAGTAVNYQQQQQSQQSRQANGVTTANSQQQQLLQQNRQTSLGTSNNYLQPAQQSRPNNFGSTNYQSQTSIAPKQANFEASSYQETQNRQANIAATGFQQQSRQTTGNPGFSQQRQNTFQQQSNVDNNASYQTNRQQGNTNDNYQQQQNRQQGSVAPPNNYQSAVRSQTQVANGNYQQKDIRQQVQSTNDNFSQQQSQLKTSQSGNFQQQSRQQTLATAAAALPPNRQQAQQQQQQQYLANNNNYQQNRQAANGASAQTRVQTGQQSYSGANNQQSYSGTGSQQSASGASSQQASYTPQTNYYNGQQSYNAQQNYNRQSGQRQTSSVNRNYDEFDEGDNQEFLKTAPSNNLRPSDLNSFTNTNYNANASKISGNGASSSKYITPTIVTTPRTTPVYDTPPARQTYQQSTAQPTNYYTPTVSTTQKAYTQASTGTTTLLTSSKLPQRIYPSPTPSKATQAKDTAYDYAYYDDSGASFPDYGSFDHLGESDFSRTNQRTKSRLI